MKGNPTFLDTTSRCLYENAISFQFAQTPVNPFHFARLDFEQSTGQIGRNIARDQTVAARSGRDFARQSVNVNAEFRRVVGVFELRQ